MLSCLSSCLISSMHVEMYLAWGQTKERTNNRHQIRLGGVIPRVGVSYQAVETSWKSWSICCCYTTPPVMVLQILSALSSHVMQVLNIWSVHHKNNLIYHWIWYQPNFFYYMDWRRALVLQFRIMWSLKTSNHGLFQSLLYSYASLSAIETLVWSTIPSSRWIMAWLWPVDQK